MENNDKKKIVLSGIRATGNLHLGNYYGALRNFVRMQNDYDCRYFVADLHALTTHPDPKMLHENVKDILAEYLAAGLDPDKNTIYVQSDVPEISEMYLLMNMHVGIGELMRTASFKDKARKALGIHSEGDEIEKEIIGNQTNQRVNAGLLTYPTLMAVDILIHHADLVPVGKDQEQHLELTRRFARRFNSFYKTEYFHEPFNFNFGAAAVKVPGLDGSGKMGKSEGNCIYLIDDEKTLRKKVMHRRGSQDSGQPCQRAYRQPVHPHGSGVGARCMRPLPPGLRRLLHPLRRSQEAAGRRHTESHASHPRTHPRHPSERRVSVQGGAPGCRTRPRDSLQDTGRRARDNGYQAFLSHTIPTA